MSGTYESTWGAVQPSDTVIGADGKHWRIVARVSQGDRVNLTMTLADGSGEPATGSPPVKGKVTVLVKPDPDHDAIEVAAAAVQQAIGYVEELSGQPALPVVCELCGALLSASRVKLHADWHGSQQTPPF